jgi:hypothetical protein
MAMQALDLAGGVYAHLKVKSRLKYSKKFNVLTK